MKKYALMAMMALALGFTACDDPEEAQSKPQAYPQEPIFDASSIVINPSEQTNNVIDLASLIAQAQDQQLINLGTFQIADFPADYDLKLVLEIAKDQRFRNVSICPVEIIDGVIYTEADQLNGAYLKQTKDPRKGTVWMRYEAFATNQYGDIRLGGDKTFAEKQITLIPSSSEEAIDDLYKINGQDMNHPAGVSAYDDPVFSYYVPNASNYTFTISNPAGKVWGQDPEVKNGLLEGGAPIEAGKDGNILIAVNMRDLTYRVIEAVENLFTPGDSNSWNFGKSQQLYTNAGHAQYMGFAYLSGNFKFNAGGSWSGVSYGYGGAGMLSDNGGAGNISAGGVGLYWCEANVASLTYSLNPIKGVSINGCALTPSDDFLTWTGKVKFDGKAWTILCAGYDDVVLGGNQGDLKANGAALPAVNGEKNVTLSLGSLPYGIVIE